MRRETRREVTRAAAGERPFPRWRVMAGEPAAPTPAAEDPDRTDRHVQTSRHDADEVLTNHLSLATLWQQVWCDR
jgi:hypothetical protein